MKKSKAVELVLVASIISSCQNHKPVPEKRVYMRSDTTAYYSHAHGLGLLGAYYAFRPYGIFRNNGYSRAGYFSSAINLIYSGTGVCAGHACWQSTTLWKYSASLISVGFKLYLLFFANPL